jgi:hypothetical protein
MLLLRAFENVHTIPADFGAAKSIVAWAQATTGLAVPQSPSGVTCHGYHLTGPFPRRWRSQHLKWNYTCF